MSHQALFEQAVVMGHVDPQLQKLLSMMVTLDLVDVNFALQYEGTQSGNGGESNWVELLDGNYLRWMSFFSRLDHLVLQLHDKITLWFLSCLLQVHEERMSSFLQDVIPTNQSSSFSIEKGRWRGQFIPLWMRTLPLLIPRSHT